jgi:hypothetical protein
VVAVPLQERFKFRGGHDVADDTAKPCGAHSGALG